MNEKLLNDIMTILKPSSSLAESHVLRVLQRLESLGYFLIESDSWVISFSIQKIENHIKNCCNLTVIPDGLIHTAVDMICGEFLLAKKQTGQLELGNLDLDGAISSIKEGDTQVNFGSGTSDEEKFQQLVSYLMHFGDGDLVCYRKIKW